MDTDIPNEMLNGISDAEAERMGLHKKLDKKELLLDELQKQGIRQEIITAISDIRREDFVPDDVKEQAYENIPLPIGHMQTISQPYTVAYMIQLLDIKPSDKILEIGSGSGYNSAVMSKFLKSGKIYSMEIIPELAEFARKNIMHAGIAHVEIISQSGYEGYEEQAPFDKIIVTAASDAVPEILLEQLKKNGILVMPVDKDGVQIMTRIVNKSKPEITMHGEFSFVDLVKD